MLSALRDSEKKLEQIMVEQDTNGDAPESVSVPNHEEFDSSGSTTQESQEQQIYNMFQQNNVAHTNDIGKHIYSLY